MKSEDISYNPISCSFHDELESLAVKQTIVEIIYLDENNKRESINSKIIDIIVQDGAEFIVLKNDLNIRLDWLISVDGKTLKDYC